MKNIITVMILLNLLAICAWSQTVKTISENDKSVMRKKFGIFIPKNIQASQKYTLEESEAKIFLIKMDPKDAMDFISKIKNTNVKGVIKTVEDPDCKRSADCPRIGSVLLPDDQPTDAVEKWQQDNNFNNDTIATFRRLKKGNKIESYAGLFLDSKKGLLILWYKR